MPNLDNIHDKFFPKAKTVTTGKTLIKFAWAIEIFVATTALAIALLMLFAQGQSGAALSTVQNVFGDFKVDNLILSIAFLVVAIMELTKIPLATAYYYSVRIGYKIIFLLALIAVNFSTFETMVTAFELRYHSMSTVVDDIRNDIEKVLINLDTLGENADDSEIKNNISKYREDIAAMDAKKNEILKTFNESLNDIELRKLEAIKQADDKYNQTVKSLTDKSDRGKPQIEQNNKKIEDLNANILNLKKENEQKTKRVDQKIKDIQSVQNTFFSNNDDLEKARIQNEINDIKREIQDNKNLISSNQKQIDQLFEINQELVGQDSNTAQKQIDIAKNIRDAEVKDAEDNAQNSINLITQSKDNDFDSIEAEKNDFRENTLQPEQDRLNKLQSDKENVDERRKDLLNEKAILEDNLNKAAKDNQIYRMAEKINVVADWFTGNERPKGQIITQGELDRAFWIWFGGLSIVLSIIGTLVAFAGLHLQDERAHQMRNKSKGPNRFLRGLKATPMYFNKFLKAARKRLLEPVKVIEKVEIEVEKIVDKIVEKPVEVEKIVEKIIEKPVEVEKIIEKIVEKPIEHEKIVFQKVEVPREIIRKEIVYVPLPTDDPELLKKGPFTHKTDKEEG